MNMVYRKIKNQHLLTEENKKRRVEYCKYWIDKSFEGIWFSDESMFQLDNQDGYAWCEKGSNKNIMHFK